MSTDQDPPRRLAEGLAWPEGPSVLPDGRVVFVECYLSRLSVWAPDGTVEQYAYTGGGPNATALGADGCIYVTQNGGVVGPWVAEDRRPGSIQRVTTSGHVEVIATEIDGIALRAPNDLAFGPDGRLYFTDPGGSYDPVTRPDPGRIFALAPGGKGELVAELEPVYPNGIVVERDGSVVWVESYEGSVKRWKPGGEARELTVLAAGHAPDGLAVADNGSLYVTTTASGGIDVLAPDGVHIGFVPVGAVPTNCAFAGSTLYVTDGGHQGASATPEHAGVLWAVEVQVTGQPLFPGTI
ncbi:MAG: SMP-30/gluconolactonase/LRE family protein [Acidimicrobiales bacterium]|jgi:gluconolactonase